MMFMLRTPKRCLLHSANGDNHVARFLEDTSLPSLQFYHKFSEHEGGQIWNFLEVDYAGFTLTLRSGLSILSWAEVALYLRGGR